MVMMILQRLRVEYLEDNIVVERIVVTVLVKLRRYCEYRKFRAGGGGIWIRDFPIYFKDQVSHD